MFLNAVCHCDLLVLVVQIFVGFLLGHPESVIEIEKKLIYMEVHYWVEIVTNFPK